MTFASSVLGKFFSRGVELDLGAGVDCSAGIVATYNDVTKRAELTADGATISKSMHDYRGDVTVIQSTVEVTFHNIALDEESIYVTVPELLITGSAITFTA
jgi:phage baseplate assembly protein gpV